MVNHPLSSNRQYVRIENSSLFGQLNQSKKLFRLCQDVRYQFNECSKLSIVLFVRTKLSAQLYEPCKFQSSNTILQLIVACLIYEIVLIMETIKYYVGSCF